MKRHEHLAQLSREHHPALVLARKMARNIVPEDLLAAYEDLRRVWAQDLQPHFLREERVLLPLSLCANEDLRQHAATITQHHTELRKLMETLTPDNTTSVAPVFAAQLEAHIRFEERHWFPALEKALDEATLARAGRRLKPGPTALIASYNQDDESIWVARLDCGHARHIHHKPPFTLAPWVLTEEGRNSQLHTELPCPLCRMPELPACAKVYKETPVFDESSVPAGLLKRHQLKAGTWGRIMVLEGHVQYVLEDDADFTLTLRPSVDGIVGPERPHHVALLPGARFQVAFLRVSEG